MVDEQNPENIPGSPEPEATNTPIVPPPAPAPPAALPEEQPYVPNTGMTPPWVKEKILRETGECGYEDCDRKLDPNTAFKDEDTGTFRCSIHAKPCEDCEEVHSIEEMEVYKPKGYRDSYWYCRDCFNERYITCPNCDEVVEKDEYLSPTRKNTYSMKQGGCKECSVSCYSCDKIVDKDYSYSHDNEEYCEDCYGEYFSSCEDCNETYSRDDLIYVEDVGDFCNHCYKEKYTKCEECDTTVEKDSSFEMDGDYYCQECYEKLGPTEYSQYTEQFSGFSYTKKDRYLNLLYKLLPISVKDLKSKHPSVANGLGDLISFSKGKPITPELVKEFRDSLAPEEFPVQYTVWDGVQRSIDTLPNENKPTEAAQLVINIQASPELLGRLKANPALYDLFDKVNTLSKKSTHPYVKDQIGWIRVEIDPNGEYLLVDEIQSDHSNAGYRLKTGGGDHEVRQIRGALKSKYQLDDEGLNKLLAEYGNLVKEFPNIASQAIVRFARSNNIKRIFWHTFESGKKLKENEPPKSLYDKTPKENFFLPSQNKPFGLEGDFFEKEAKRSQALNKLARKLYLKYLGIL